MIFRPDIKPPMWGPLSAVQYAVMVNAERMGIDPSALKLVSPFWETAGSIIYDATLQNDISTTLPLWVPAGYRCSTTNKFSPGKTLATLLGSTTSPFTILTLADIVSRPTSSNFLLGQYQDGGTGYDLGFYQSSSTRIISYYYKSGSNVQLSPGVVESGASISLGVTWDGASITGYYGGALASIASHSSALTTTHTFKAGGVWAGGNGTHDHKFLIVCSSALTADQIAQLHATPYALLMPVSRPVYFDLGATTGATLTTDSAWKIYTDAEIDTAWAIRAELSQSAAWAVFTRADAESAWSIRTSAEAETAWTVRAGLDTPTAWPISTAADTQTEWQIKAGLDAETAWPIFTAVDTATAWAILDSLALETPTAWAIRNALAADAAWSIRTALDTGSAWAILSRLDRETAWQILGAGILDTPTSWAIRADLDQATAWTIKTSLDADTDWTIINGMDTATTWDILQGFATDTAWQVYRGLDTATAWSIISDTVPEPVKVFMAERRDFIINAEKRIFILLAERK